MYEVATVLVLVNPEVYNYFKTYSTLGVNLLANYKYQHLHHIKAYIKMIYTVI